MDLKDLVVSLETAKKLKEEGFPQECVFSYFNTERDGYILLQNHLLRDPPDSTYRYEVAERIAAPTFVEIWEQLPDKCRVNPTSTLFVRREFVDGHDILRVGNAKSYGKNITEMAANVWIQCKKDCIGYFKEIHEQWKHEE